MCCIPPGQNCRSAKLCTPCSVDIITHPSTTPSPLDQLFKQEFSPQPRRAIHRPSVRCRGALKINRHEGRVQGGYEMGMMK